MDLVADWIFNLGTPCSQSRSVKTINDENNLIKLINKEMLDSKYMHYLIEIVKLGVQKLLSLGLLSSSTKDKLFRSPLELEAIISMSAPPTTTKLFVEMTKHK